eukprot:3983694-Lingulodinium_polyedra.AAC.1
MQVPDPGPVVPKQLARLPEPAGELEQNKVDGGRPRQREGRRRDGRRRQRIPGAATRHHRDPSLPGGGPVRT